MEVNCPTHSPTSSVPGSKISDYNSFSKKQRSSRFLKEYVLSLRFLLIDRESVLLGSVDAIDWVLRFCSRVSNFLNCSFIYCCSDPGKRLNPYGIIVEIEDKCESLS
ncbi:unnamed protein product [Brassica rapa subsp. narinosa]